MKNSITLIILLLITYTIAAQQKIVGPGKEVDPYHYQGVKSETFDNAAVVCAHPLASKVGVAIMKKGGNAFDAVIATQLALAVVYPEAGNIGGCGFMTARKTNGDIITLDYREMAPAKATKDMYLDSVGNPIPHLSLDGHLAVGVPGTVAGLFATYKHAKLPFKELIQPAIDLAEKGFVISQAEANGLNHNKNSFLQLNTKPTAFVKQTAWKAGDTLIQKDLAKTLMRIRDKGQKGFYEGETAKLIVEEMKRGNGIISYEDLENYVVKQRQPISFDYRGYNIISFPPPSSGGLLLAEMFKMIEKYPLSDWGFQSPQAVQLMVEVERRAYADRAQHMGDPDFWKVPVKTLMSDDYIAERMKDFTPGKASKSEDIKAGIVHESEETTHISIMDKDGNIVSVTTTLNNSYGSKTVVGDAGFLLNDEMDDFSVKPGVPNMYGAVGGAANAIEPGKRMLSSMTPTLVLKDNKPYIVVGTPGGTTIPTSVFQTIVNIIDFDMTAAESVDNPKFHHQWLPDEIMIEPAFNADTKAALEKMGYKFANRGAIGRTEVIKVVNGKLQAAADIRGDDSASGF